MLSDEVIDKVVERLVVRMEQANEYVISEIGKSINKLGTLSPSKAQELVQIMRYGGDYDKIVKKIAQITKLNKKDIYKIFSEVAKKDYEFAEQFYKYRNKKYIKWDENKQLQNQVDAIAKITADKYTDMTKTLAFATKGANGKVVYTELSKMYQKALDEAILNVSQGKETYNIAVRRIMRELAESGIRYVDYANGRSVRADSVTQRLLNDGLRGLHNELQQQFGQEFGADGVEITVHTNPAPDHQFVQGKQFSMREFDKFQNDQDAISYDGVLFPHESEETGQDRRSISQYNCYHTTISIVLGVSQPLYTNEQLQQIIDDNNKGFEFDGKHYTNYEGTQLQRKIETEIRKQKDLQIASRSINDEKGIYESQTKINQLNKKYKELHEISGLPTRADRLSVSGYHPVKVAKPSSDDISSRLSKYNISVDKDLLGSDFDKGLVNDSLNQLEKLVNKYPVLKKKIKEDGLSIRPDYSEYAGTTSKVGNEIILSKGLYQNKSKLLSLMKEGQDDNWSAKVKKQNYDIYTITHETGHILEDAIMKERVKKKEGIDLTKLLTEGYNDWLVVKHQHQEDTDIFNEIFVPVSEKLNVSWEELHSKYISDYGKSDMFFEWFAELFTKMELGEQDIMTKALKEYLEGELWKK